MRESVALPILESSQAGEARRMAIALAGRLGFDETERGKVGIVVTELANNLVQHAKDGVLLLQAIEQHNVMGIAILSLDKGPGLSNINECLRDGFSTGTTPGNGLGAVKRLSDQFEIYSLPETGTAILARLWAHSAAIAASSSPVEEFEISAVCLPKVGEEVSGDAWASWMDTERCLLLVADGLGHGALAAEASLAAVRIFHDHAHRSPKEIMEAAHGALRSTRGAAVAIAEINFASQSMRYAGVGNIAGSVFAPAGSYNMVSHNGTVGHEVRKIQEFTYPWHTGGMLIMHSDGLATQWRLERYLGLSQQPPYLIAGVLYRDFNRVRDDVTVLVARENM